MSEQLFCARNCEWPEKDDQPAHPKLATHGTLCDSCFVRVRLALKTIPELLMNMRAAVFPASNFELTERVQGGGDGSPAPLQVGALDSSDALFVKLANWVEAIAEAFGVAKPSISVWMGPSEAQGMRMPVSPIAAYSQAKQLVHWFLARLEKIAALDLAAAFLEDIAEGQDDSPGAYKLMRRYGSEQPKPRDSQKRECPVCGKREVFVAHPSSFNSEVMVLCGLCAESFDLSKYPELVEMLRTA